MIAEITTEGNSPTIFDRHQMEQINNWIANSNTYINIYKQTIKNVHIFTSTQKATYYHKNK
jgi:hypothetical protein